jgi:hypothetical protein
MEHGYQQLGGECPGRAAYVRPSHPQGALRRFVEGGQSGIRTDHAGNRDDTIVTDSGFPTDLVAQLEEQGVEVIIAQ